MSVINKSIIKIDKTYVEELKDLKLVDLFGEIVSVSRDVEIIKTTR
jgi:hypothetical protein